MAKFDEADPRWLVKDLGEGGRNVNNWHWNERDCTEWARERLSRDLAGVALTAAPAATRTTTFESMSGEAFLNVRKNKLIPAYDLEVRVAWSGELTDGDGNVVGSATGKLHFPHIGDDNHDEDVEIRILTDTNSPEAERLKAAIHAKGKRPLLDLVQRFVNDLRAGGPALTETADATSGAATNGAAAAKPTAAASAAPPAAAKAAAAADAKPKAPAAATSSGAGGEHSIAIKQRFHCRPSDIYECFTVQGRVCAFTQSPATVQPTPGGAFSWYGGSITGEFVELSPPNRIVMRWRFNTWAEGVFSKVTLDISEPEYGNTVLKVRHTELPAADKFGSENVKDLTERGWENQVLMRIRQVFGYA